MKRGDGRRLNESKRIIGYGEEGKENDWMFNRKVIYLEVSGMHIDIESN